MCARTYVYNRTYPAKFQTFFVVLADESGHIAYNLQSITDRVIYQYSLTPFSFAGLELLQSQRFFKKKSPFLQEEEEEEESMGKNAVSYTHLTLPTIYSV